jgi:hypothetical protein
MEFARRRRRANAATPLPSSNSDPGSGTGWTGVVVITAYSCAVFTCPSCVGNWLEIVAPPFVEKPSREKK